MKFYYVIIKSWWEVLPNIKYRVKRKVSYFRYKTYKDAHKIAIRLRERDINYRYDLGDRIYVKKCYG